MNSNYNDYMMGIKDFYAAQVACVWLTFLTRAVRSWTNSLRRLWRVWSSRAYSRKRQRDRGNRVVGAVRKYLVDQWPLREPSESWQQIMTYNSLFQPFEILLWLLVSLMEKSVDRQNDRWREVSHCWQNNSWIKNKRSMDWLPHSWAVTHLPSDVIHCKGYCRKRPISIKLLPRSKTP